MDTLTSKNKSDSRAGSAEYAPVILLFCALFTAHSIFLPSVPADNRIASNSAAVPTMRTVTEQIKEEFNPAIKKEKFEKRISDKYRGLTVNSVADGVKHIKTVKYYNGKPVRINIVEINRTVAKDFEIKPATASTTLPHKNTIRTIAGKNNSVVAINGGYFKPQTGVPLGLLMIDEKIYTGPIYDRAALGIFDDGYDVGRVRLNAKISGNGTQINIDNINQPRMLSSYVLAYTRDWGTFAPVSPQYGVQFQIVGNKITKVSANPLSIPENGYVIVGPKSKLKSLYGAKEVNVSINTLPRWENVRHIISGGPFLLKDGEIFIDTQAEKLQAVTGRNPRTAIGYTKDNDLILITADGREGSSIGLTLVELAYLMKSLGCINAINLDGGGSTVMYVNGQIVNRPQQPGGIALSNVLVVSKKTRI